MTAMYPYIRAIHQILRHRRSKPLDLFDEHVTRHRAWPWDTDVFGELNNGRILTLFELGRWGLTARTGLLRPVVSGGIGFAVAGASVRYRRRIPVFSTYEMRTRMVGFDDKFMYADQSMWLGDTRCNQMLLRAAFTEKRKILPPAELLARVGRKSESPPLPDWVTAWIAADAALFAR